MYNESVELDMSLANSNCCIQQPMIEEHVEPLTQISIKKRKLQQRVRYVDEGTRDGFEREELGTGEDIGDESEEEEEEEEEEDSDDRDFVV